MAKSADDFNAIINGDRQRRKNEALAQEIFGKGRRSSAPGAGIGNRKPGTGPSLASRIGITKRSVSNAIKPAVRTKPAGGNVDAEWTHDLHSLNNPSASRGSQLPNRAGRNAKTRTERLYAAFSSSSPALNDQVNILNSARSKSFSIRGLAGPYKVIAKNFANGTTAADIESAMVQVGRVILDCQLIAERPNIIAEIVFETKENADAVVETFNKQNADGNILHVYHKTGPSAPKVTTPTTRPAIPRGPRADILNDRSDDSRSENYNSTDRYTPRKDRRRESTRDDVIDGSYGFDDRMDVDDRDDRRGRGLYSDDLVGNRDNRGRGDGRDRGRNYYRGRGRRD